jgi:hypothetical protein
MPHRHHLILAVSFATGVALSVAGTTFAQTTAPATPTITPEPTCEKPGDAPSSGASELGRAALETKRNNWMRSMKAYLDCLKAFVTEQQAAAAPHLRAANTAVEQYNKSTKIFNDYVEAALK